MAKNVFELWGELRVKGAEEIKQKLNDVGKKAQETGQTLKDLGSSLTTHVTAPLAALGAGAIASAIQVDSAAGSMQAQLGLSAEEAAKLNDQAKELWTKGFGADMADVTNKVAAVTRSLGDLNDQDLETVIGGIDVLEKQFGADTQEQMRAVNTLMDNFGMNATEAMDYLTAGFQNNLDYSGEFLDTISEYSTYFSEMGFSGQEFFNSLAAGAEGGAFQLDKVGDSMKEFSIRSKETSDTTVAAFEGLSLPAAEMISAFNAGGEEAQAAFEKTVTALQNVEDETARNSIAVDLFGTQYEDLGEKAFDALLTASDSFGEVEGKSRSASEAMRDNFGTDLQIVWRETQEALLPLGETLIDLAKNVLPPLSTGIAAVSTWFQGLSGPAQALVLSFMGLAAAAGPIILFIGSLISAISGMIPVIVTVWGWFSKLKTLFTVVRTAMLAFSGPVGLIILGITALVAAALWLWENWDQVKAWLTQAWEAIKTMATNTFNKVKEAVITKFNETKTKVIDTWETIKSGIIEKANSIWNKTKEIFEKVRAAIWDPIKTARDKIEGAINDIKAFFEGLKGKLKIEIPDIKLPHFGVKNWSLNPKDWLANPPKLTVNWKARGGIVDGAQLVGVGEAGPEAIIPLSGARKMAPFAKALAAHMPGLGGAIRVEVPVYLDGREIARASTPYIDRQLERERRKQQLFKGI